MAKRKRSTNFDNSFHEVGEDKKVKIEKNEPSV